MRRFPLDKRFHQRRLLVGAGLCSLGLLLSACLAPTLPLPPPSRPNVSAPDEEGNIRITGVAYGHAKVFAQNLRTDSIAGQHTGPSGRFDFTMAAEVGDRISIWQVVGTEASGSDEIIVPEETTLDGTPSPPEGMGGSE